MIRQRKIELLAPAKNLECGIAAVDHGADAIYIGAPVSEHVRLRGIHWRISLSWCGTLMCIMFVSM